MLDVQALINDAQEAVNNFEVEYKLKHGDNLDFGACGYGYPIINFGRKRKLREYLAKNGLGLDKSFMGGGYMVKLPVKQTIWVQNADFNQTLARRLADVLESHLGDQVGRVGTYTWID